MQHAHKLHGAVSVFSALIVAAVQRLEKPPGPLDWPALEHQRAQLETDVRRLLPELAALAPIAAAAI